MELTSRYGDSMYTDSTIPGVSKGGEATVAGKEGVRNSDIAVKPKANTVSALTYDGSTLAIHDASGKTSRYPASSGRPGITDPTIRNQGPIPSGVYFVNRRDITPGGFLRDLTGDWGKFRVPLKPVPGAGDMFGRDEFFLHGGSKPGSAGCIDCGGADETIFPILQRQVDPVPVIVTLPSKK